MKKPKTGIVDDKIKKIENSLLALKVFGGITKVQIPIEVPEDDTKLDELELIYNAEHQDANVRNLEEEARELLLRYNAEIKKQKIAELNEKLANTDEDSDEYSEILYEIRDLQKT